MKKIVSQTKKLLKGRTWLSLMILGVALLVELISAAQYYYTKSILEEELETRAASEIVTKAILVKGMLNTTEGVLNSHVDDLKQLIKEPQEIGDALESIVEANPYFNGLGLAFKPGYYDDEDDLFEPWAFNINNEIKVMKDIAKRGGHDYTTLNFYTQPMATGKPYWSDPYIDYDVTKKFITTYSIPLRDSRDSIAAVAGIDLSLSWLSDTLNNRHIYPSSFCLLLTDDGKLISQPASNHPRHCDFDDAIRLINDSTAHRRVVTNTKINVIEFKSEKDGEDACVFFHHMKGNPHWQVAVVCYDNEVFGQLDKMRFRILLLMILGFALLGYIIYRFFKNNNQLIRSETDRQRIEGELQVAQRIQSEMLPHASIDHSNIDIASALVAAREVGGDIYDYFIRDDKLFFAIGDASGKGVPSALVMSVTHSLFRAIGSRESNPMRIMQLINHAVCQGNDSSMFVTFFIGVLDLPTGRLHYCNAGHDTPLIISDTASKLNVKPNLPLGVMEDWQYDGQEAQLQPNNIFLLYTDGLTEAMNSSRQQFGLSRVIFQANVNAGVSPQRLLDDVLHEVHTFVGDAEQSDDLTMLAIKYTPTAETIIFSREISITNDLQHVETVNDWVEEVCHKLSMSESNTSSMKLAVEEAVVNVINYAYPAGEIGDISIEATATAAALKFKITDSGVSFAPTDAPDVDTSLSAEERRIGGLGIFLVRQLMDTINYERIDGKNVLTLTKLR